jgi:ABC-type Fe3+-hydroxamate transport system substrate-binding protein
MAMVDDENEDKDSQNILVQQVAEMFGWSAELVDFWHCLLEYDCRSITYALSQSLPQILVSSSVGTHTSFPLAALEWRSLTVRSNWQQYPEEFAPAAEVVAGLNAPDYRRVAIIQPDAFFPIIYWGMMTVVMVQLSQQCT